MYTLKGAHGLSYAIRQNRVVAPRRRNTSGVALIEVLVGVTIGVLVAIAAIGSLSFVKATSLSITESLRLHQRADAIFRNISYHLIQAGSVELISASGDGTMVNFSTSYVGFNPTITGATAAGPNKEIYSIHGVNGDGTSNSLAPDTLRVSYQNNGDSMDCLSYNPSGAGVDNQFYVTQQELMCAGATGAAPQSLGSGVEDFQVLYSVRRGQDSQHYRADEMLGFGQIPNWDYVQLVTICLQLVGETQSTPEPEHLIKGCKDQTIEGDGRIRRVFHRTFALRNSLS